jgi:hypothetical protein
MLTIPVMLLAVAASAWGGLDILYVGVPILGLIAIIEFFSGYLHLAWIETLQK